MWSLKKTTWVNGPDHRLLEDSSMRLDASYCTATFNRSHFAMIAFKYYQLDPLTMPNRRFALVEHQTQKVAEYPNLPFQGHNNFVSCSASIMHSKSNEGSVVIHLKSSTSYGQFRGFSHLMSYNLNQGLDGQWKMHGTWDYDSNVLGFWQLRGSFYSLLSNGNFIRHQNLHDWHALANFSQNFLADFSNGVIYYV